MWALKRYSEPSVEATAPRAPLGSPPEIMLEPLDAELRAWLAEEQLAVLENILSWHGYTTLKLLTDLSGEEVKELLNVLLPRAGICIVQALGTPQNLKGWQRTPAVAGDLVVEEFPITFEGYTYKYGRIAYIMGRRPSPVILVHHNFAGLKQFDVDQACFMARIGYVGVAVDLYQEKPNFTYHDRGASSGRLVDFESYCQEVRKDNLLNLPDGGNYPTEMLRAYFDGTPKKDGKVDYQAVRNFVGAFTEMNRLLRGLGSWRGLMQANLEQAFNHPAVKSGCAGAFGYCLGGQSCLEHVRAGHPVQAVCSLHGLLHSRPLTDEEPLNSHKRMSREEYAAKLAVPNSYNRNCKVLIENGDLDDEVPADTIVDFVQEMDAQEIDWRFDNHARGPHGFALGKGVPGCQYVEHIDRRSTITMLSLFAETWPDFEQHPVKCNASGTSFELPRPRPGGGRPRLAGALGFLAGAVLSITAIKLLRASL
ncbi:unnamed protein product [Effrenium voratum]|uniref:Dienelactone hydrolase domain-containing protein n=1 Tax=Effrenium voratum TaxID=2562239 RepID=A0AA36N9Y1_9DINO|nr:unnamed protein product [Effrenium voratum]